jgi:hypothetical protein
MRVDKVASCICLALDGGVADGGGRGGGGGGACAGEAPGRGLQSSSFQLNLSRFGHTFPCPPV